MSYTVVWQPTAERELINLWLDAAHRNAVTAAAGKIERLLQSRAESVGESRSEGRRILHEFPLGVLYRVEPQDRMVYVLCIWRYRSKRRPM